MNTMSETQKFCLVLIIGALHSMSLVFLVIEPLLSWLFGIRADYLKPSLFLNFHVVAFTVAFSLFYLPVFFITEANRKLLLYKLSLKAIWTAVPGIVVFLVFSVNVIGRFISSKAASFIAWATYIFAWFLPLLVVLFVPIQTKMFWEVLRINTSLSAGKALMVAILFTLLPFLGVTGMVFVFQFLSN